jgi:hypothetical protein
MFEKLYVCICVLILCATNIKNIKKRYVRLRAEKEIVGKRAGRLEAMRRGFSDLPLGPHLRLFSVFDLMSLVCGKQVFHAHTHTHTQNIYFF